MKLKSFDLNYLIAFD